MSRKNWSLTIAVVACLVVPGLALAQGAGPVYTPLVAGWEQFFTVTSETVQPGGTRVAGYVTNESGFAARRIQILVDALDDSGRITGQTVAWLGTGLGPGSRGYFNVPAPAGRRHRVSVFAYDWIQTASMAP